MQWASWSGGTEWVIKSIFHTGVKSKSRMKIKNLNGGSKWHHRKSGVIYVEHDWQKNELHKLLCRQDEHWRHKSFLIQTWIGPKTLGEVKSEAKYTDKTDIYEVEELRKIIPFIFFQFDDLGCIEENHD